MKVDVIPVRLNSTWVLVRAQMVSEFLSRTPWLSVPGSTPLVPGVMTWRGKAIPVLDLSRALQLGSIAPLDEYARVMVLEHALGCIAAPVDGAREAVTIADEDIHPPHVTNVPYAAGEVTWPNTVMPLIELDQLLQELTKTGVS